MSSKEFFDKLLLVAVVFIVVPWSVLLWEVSTSFIAVLARTRSPGLPRISDR
jgi:hypothetical protein